MPDSLDRIIDLSFELGRIFRHKMVTVVRNGEPVNFLQMHALVLIRKKPGITMKELAESLHITSPSATSFVNRLAALTWVRRDHDDKNRKLVRLSVTAAGDKIILSKMTGRRRELRRIIGLLPEKERAAMAVILKHLLDALHDSSTL